MTRSRALRDLYERISKQARHRCGYCLTLESVVGAPMELEHIVPSRLVERLKGLTFGWPARGAILIRPIESPLQTPSPDASSGCLIRAGKCAPAILNGPRQAMLLSARQQQDALQLSLFN